MLNLSMKIDSVFLFYKTGVGRNARVALELFRTLDIHNEMALNDIQFWAFMKGCTDLDTNQIYKVRQSSNRQT